MRRLLAGDIGRIIFKKSFCVSFIILMTVSIAVAAWQYYLEYQTGYAFMYYAVNCISISVMILGLIIFMGAYADEFSSMMLANVIGRGFSRKKVVLAKLLASAILLLALTVVFTASMLILKSLMGVDMTDIEYRALLLASFTDFYDTMGAIAISALFIFVSGNIALGIFMYIGVSLLLPVVFALTDMIPALSGFHFSRYSFSGLNNTGFSMIMTGSYVQGIITLALSGLLYIGLSTAAALYVFIKKELEF